MAANHFFHTLDSLTRTSPLEKSMENSSDENISGENLYICDYSTCRTFSLVILILGIGCSHFYRAILSF